MQGVYPTPLPQVPLVYQPPPQEEPPIPQAQQAAQEQPATHQHLITGIVSTMGEKATLPEEYFPYQTAGGTPATFQDTGTIPRAPTGSGYYWGMKGDKWGFYKAFGSQPLEKPGDPWKEYYAEHPKPSPELTGQLQQISASGEAQFQQSQIAIQQYGKATYRGEFSEYGLKLAQAPIGTPIPTPQEYMKIQQLQTGKAVFASEEEFRQIVEPLSKYSEFAGTSKFRGNVPVTVSEQTGIYPSYLGEPQPSPFAKFVESQRYPSTPIDYSKTHVSELYSYPVYKGAAFVSGGLQAGYERIVDILPQPQPLKEIQKGVGSMFTGIPEFVASGISGWEYAAREPKIFKEGIVPAVKSFGVSITTQATERPFYTLGQAAVLGYGMRGIKTPSISGIKSKISFEPASGIQSFKEILPKIEPSSKIVDITAAKDVFAGYKTGFLEEYGKPSLQTEKVMVGKETASYFGGEIKTELARPTMRGQAVSSVIELAKGYGTGIKFELMKPTLRGEALVSASQVFKGYQKGIGYELARPTRGKQAFAATSELFRGYKSELKYELTRPTMRGEAIVGAKQAFGEFRIEAGREFYKPTVRGSSVYAARDIFKGYAAGFTKAYKGTYYKPPIKFSGGRPPKLKQPELKIKAVGVESLQQPTAEFRGFSEEQIKRARKNILEPSYLKPSGKPSPSRARVFDVSKYTSETLTFPKGRFEGIEKGSSLFAQYPTGRRGGIPRGGAFAEFRASIEGKKSYIDVTVKQKDTSVIDRRKIKAKPPTAAPKFDIPESFFAKELTEMEALKIKPKKTAPKPEDIFKITTKPKETYIEREIKTGTGQILIQRQLLKPLLKPPELKTEKAITPSMKAITPSMKTAQKPLLKGLMFPQTRTGLKTPIQAQTRQKQLIYISPKTPTSTKVRLRPAQITTIGTVISPVISTGLKTPEITRQIIKIRIPSTPTLQPLRLKPPKTRLSSDLLQIGKKRRKGRKKGSKFPEITRVAMPKQVMKGFKL